MLHGSRITIPFDTGAASGSKTQTTNLDKFDLSRCKVIDVWVSLTTADTDLADLFDIFFEETIDGVTFDQRLHSHQFTGDMTASATAPEVRRYRIYGHTVTDVLDEIYETSGSAGGTALAAGAVRHGPFVPKLASTSAPFTGQTTHRFRFVTVDTDVDARFSGTVTLALNSPI
jgi:hypothetical protein